MESIIVKIETEKKAKLIDFLETMQIYYKYEKSSSKKVKKYNPEFVQKVLNSKNEKTTRIDPQNIWQNI